MAVSLHPSIDNGLKKGDPNFAGGTLACKCGAVEVALGSNVAHNHACGCTKCWKPGAALFSQVAVVSRENLTVSANGNKLKVVDPEATIQRYACTGCGVHMYGRIENKNHPLYGFDFIHTELSSQQGWSPRGIRVRSSRRLSSRAPIRRTWALSDRLRELSLEPMIAYRRG